MIYRIASNEWLRRVSNMTEGEKQDLSKRVGEWLKQEANILLPKANEPSARIMSVEQVCGGWSTDAQDAFNEGVRLMTPFAGIVDTWLPTMIYTKAAKRSIHRIIDVLTQCLQKSGVKPTPGRDTTLVAQPQSRTVVQPQDSTTAKINAVVTEVGAAVPRPKHIDQYAHLLPEETRKRAANYGQMMKDLGTARGNMRLLMDDAGATATERERWAKTAVALDKGIGDLRRELDKEWDKVASTGRVVVDDLGMAHILDENGKVADETRSPSIAKGQDGERQTRHKKKRALSKKYTDEEKAARVKYLQKWLRDPRPAGTPEHKKQWKENAKELIGLGVELSESMKKTAAYYKIRIPK